MINIYSSVYILSRTKIGGYGYIIHQPSGLPIIHGYKRFELITNSKLELLCALDCLKNLCKLDFQKSKVTFHCSSKYLMGVFANYDHRKSNYVNIINKIRELSGLFDFKTEFTPIDPKNYWQSFSYTIAREASMGNRIV